MSGVPVKTCSIILNFADPVLTSYYLPLFSGCCYEQSFRIDDVEVLATVSHSELCLRLSAPYPLAHLGEFRVKVAYKGSESSFKDLGQRNIPRLSGHSCGITRFVFPSDASLADIPFSLKIEVTGIFSPSVGSNGCDNDNGIAYEGSATPPHALRNIWAAMEFADFNLVARGGREIPCHRCILCSSSPVLKKLLTADMEEGRQGFDNIDEEEDVLRAFLQYIYMGSLPADADHSLLLKLMCLGDYYQVTGLPNKCASMMLPQISEENILEVLRVLSPLSQFSAAIQCAFNEVLAMVKSDQDLLTVVCSNVVPPGFHVVRSQGIPIAQEAPEDVKLQVHTLVISEKSDKQVEHDGNAAFAQVKGEPSNNICGIGDSERQQDAMCNAFVECNQQVSAILGVDVEVASQSFESEDSPRPLLEAGFNRDLDATASSGSAARQQPSSGPRRKTRRGKRAPKQEHVEQVSIPDTHISWR